MELNNRVKKGRARLLEISNQDGLGIENKKILLSLSDIYEDAIRRGLYVSGISHMEGGFYDSVWFRIRLGDSPRIWRVVIDKIYVNIAARLFHPGYDYYLIEVQVHQSRTCTIRHPHSLSNRSICLGVNLNNIATNTPSALIPTIIQGASTVSGDYVLDMALTMRTLGKEVPANVSEDWRGKDEN